MPRHFRYAIELPSGVVEGAVTLSEFGEDVDVSPPPAHLLVPEDVFFGLGDA